MTEEWKHISTAPTLDRILVAGWQKPSGNVAGYWWYYEDMTDENGVPIDCPTALRWRPWSAAPTEAP